MASLEQDAVGDGPYRSAPLSGPPGRRRWPYVVAAVAAGLCAWWLAHGDEEAAPTLAEVPNPFVHHLSAYPVPIDGLPQATPLGPLLAADRPAGLAITSPSAGATRLMRGESLWVRFNRPMVEGYEVGAPLDESPIVLAPRVGGSFSGVAQWTTRSTLRFTPDPSAWRRSREAAFTIRPGSTSLDGASVEEEFERVLVIDATPRFVTGGGSVSAGAPLPLYFDERVNLGELTREMFAYEIGGGARNLPFALVARGFDRRGFRVDVRPRRSLEAGAQIGVALAPRWGRYAYERPIYSTFRLEPPPQVTGVDCDAHLTCASPAVPGRVVDIGPTLRVATSEPIAAPSPSQVRISPRLRAAAVTLAEGSRLLEISGEWEPDQVYEVHIGGLRTVGGDALRRLPGLAVRSAGHAPQVVVQSGHFVWEPTAPTHIYFRGVNLAAANAEYQAVAPGDELRAVLDPTRYVRAMETAAATEGVPAGPVATGPVATGPVAMGPVAARLSLAALAPDARPNRWDQGRVTWRGEGRESSMAIVAFRAAARPTTGSPGAAPTVFAQQTDLATTMRIVHDGVLFWVTSLSTAAPVAGAAVTLAERADEVLASGETDRDGVLWLPLSGRAVPERLAARVTHGRDRAVVVTQRGTAVEPSRFHLASSRTVPPEGQPVASVLTDRGAYRPREIVRVRGVVRRVNRRHLSAFGSEEVLLRVTAGGGDRPLAERRVRTNEHGTVSTSFTLPARVPLGTYAVQVVRPAVPPSEESAGASEVLLGASSIRVASFRQPSFRVDISRPNGDGEPPAADGSRARPGDALSFDVAATYLFGAPVSQGRLRWSLVREGGAPYPRRFHQFHFGPTDESPNHGTVSQGQRGLGEAALRVDAAAGLEATHRERLVFEVEAEDRSGQATSAHADMVLYPAAVEVGLRRGDAWVPHGEPVPMEVVVIDNDGEPVAGRSVRARVRREGWHSYWEWAGGHSGAGYRVRRERQRELVHSCRLTTTADPTTAPASCLFEPTRPGTYLLEVETEDERGRRSLATRRLYVAGPDEVPDRDPMGTSIALTPTRRRWSVGETAQLAFESPWESAEALISVEQEGVLYHERRTVGAGGQIVEIPLGDMMVPNVFVAVTLVRARVGEPQAEHDVHGPDLRFGVAELEVLPAADRLEVAVAAPESARPGEVVELSVEVRGPDGPLETELALWVVDEGSLRLTDYETPDPTRGLFPLKPADFRWHDSRRSLVSRVEPDSWRAGGGGGGEGQRILRQDDVVLEPNPLWLPHLETDAEGRATVRFQLPERSTEYRVMALALDDGVAWGKDQTNIVVSRPVVLRDAVPRFVTRGDTFEAAVFVHNVSDEPTSTTLSVEVGGRALADEVLELAPGEQRRVARQLTASLVGTLNVRFGLDGAHPVTLERAIPVAPRARWVRSHAFGVVSGARGTEDNGPIALALPPSERGAVNVSIAAHPFVGIRSIVDSLEESRWGGARAYAATLTGLASQLRLADALPSPLRPEASDEALRDRGRRAVLRLLGVQSADGAFGRWSAHGAADPWETAFATQALLAAEGAGLEVPATARERALGWLETAANRATFGDAYGRHSPAALAYALRVLAEAGRPQAERAAALYEQRELLGPGAMAHLAMVFEPGDSRRTTLTLEAASAVLVGRDDEDADPSLLRHWARHPVVLGPVLEAAASIPEARSSVGSIAAEVLALIDPRSAHGWGTSVDAAFGARALAAYAGVFERTSEGPATLLVDGDALEPRQQTETAAFVQLPGALFDGQAHTLELAPADDGLAFFAIDGEWAAPVSEADEVARGRRVALHRRFETTTGRELAPGDAVELGELVRVRLFVYSEGTPPAFTMIHDPLGGGFEAVQRQFATSPRASVEAMLGMGPDDDAADPRGHYALRSAGQITHRQLETNAAQFYFDRLPAGLQEFTYVVRATTVGTFTLPPAQLEAVRDTEFVGRSTAFSLQVRARPEIAEAP